MTRMGWLLASVAVVALVAGSLPVAKTFGQEEAPVAPEKKKPRVVKPRSEFRGEHQIMVTMLELDEDQQAKLKAALAAEKQSADAWNKENGEKYKQLQQQMAKIREDLGKLQSARTAAAAKAGAARTAFLTDEQKLKWQGFQLYRSMMGRFRRAGLTEEQDTKVREMCNAAAADALKIAPDDAKAARAVSDKLSRKIQTEALTDEQREKLNRPRTKRTPKPAKPKVDKKPAPTEG